MTFIQHEDSAGLLLNRMNHIYGRISVSREQEWSSNNDKVPEGINDVIDEIMEYKTEILVPDIDDHMFRNDDGIYDDGDDNKEQEMTMEISDDKTMSDGSSKGRLELSERDESE